MRFKLAMFDMDGTLYDTIDSNYYSYKEALERMGYGLDRDFFIEKCFGHNYKYFVPLIVAFDLGKKYDKSYDSEEIAEKAAEVVTDDFLHNVHTYKKDVYTSHLNKIRVNKHLIDIISLIKNEYNVALVTTASKKNVYEILNFFGHKELFDYIFTQEDVKEQKPNPKCYMMAMDRFECSPEDSIIFEDSPAGLEAAHASGARVFKVEKF